MQVDTAKITRLKEKFAKYGPYATKQGLKAISEQLNDQNFKMEMYPPDNNGSPFLWSSAAQRMYVYANVDLPYSRSYRLALEGEFEVDEERYWIGYTNAMPQWVYILHPSYIIAGHKARGWKPVNEFVVKKSSTLLPIFKRRVLDAWNEMESIVYGGAFGL